MADEVEFEDATTGEPIRVGIWYREGDVTITDEEGNGVTYHLVPAGEPLAPWLEQGYRPFAVGPEGQTEMKKVLGKGV